MQSLGFSDRWAALVDEVVHPNAPPDQSAQAIAPGRVIRRDRGWALVATADGSVQVEIVGHSEEIAVGDWVVMAGNHLLKLLPRTGALRRMGPDGREQVLAANIDLVLLVCGLDRPVKPGRVHRGAVQAWDAGARPVVVLNKADLSEQPHHAASLIAAHTPELEVLTVSSTTGVGIDAVRALIRDRTAVLLGESGAGKSSLLNALAGRHLTEEGEVRAVDSKGRHTTTRRELYLLPTSGAVIDTPGIRAFGLASSVAAVESVFEDVENLAEQCRFSNCGHATEPGCAVKDAVETGLLLRDRLDAYLGLRQEVEEPERQSRPHERKRSERRVSRRAREGRRANRGQPED